MTTRPVLVDSDTASDDALALLMLARSPRIDLEAVTIVAGNADFDRQVENAKYVLDLAGVADDVPVYEGARAPLLKPHETAEYVHGEGGLGDLRPETDVPTAAGFGPERIVRAARERPGELTLLCIGPLTNAALALSREPDLAALLDEVWVMGGAANALGNVTPAAEYNFWVDPEAAKRAVAALDPTIVDWGVCTRDCRLGPETFALAEREPSPHADFVADAFARVREYDDEQGTEDTVAADAVAAAALVDPDVLVDAGRYHVDVDERAGLTRGYSLVDEGGVTDAAPNARLVESVDRDRFVGLVHDLLRGEVPGA